MKIHHSVLIAALVVSGLATARVEAQEAGAQETVCRDDETVSRCFERLVDEATGAPSAASGEATQDEADELQKKATGPNVAEDLAQSAIRDFLPRFAGTLLTSDPTEDLRALDFRFNTPMGRSGGPRLTLQGGVTLHAAELYTPLVDSIPESTRDASRERMTKELEDGDDATAFVTFNLESRTLGRDFANQQAFVDQFAAAIRDSANRIAGEPPQIIGTFLRDFSQTLGLIGSIQPTRRDDPRCVDIRGNPLSTDELPVSCLTEAVRNQMEAMLVPVTRFEARQELTMVTLVSNSGFNRLADLVNNQPQLNFSAEYRSRVRVVGPDEWVGRARFEMGFANMNGLRRECARADSTAQAIARRDTVTLACLREYTRSPSVQRSLAHGDRLWFAGEVRYRPEYHVELAEDSVDFTLGSGVGFGVSGGYGRYLGSAERDDEDRDRIDLHVSYDHSDSEDLRQSRFLAGVFYTLRISGNASGVVGLAWANKPEFVEGADRHLHANLGLSYKFNRGKQDD